MKCLNVTNVATAIVTVGLILVLGHRVEAQSPSGSSVSKIVTGEVAQVEGAFHRTTDALGLDHTRYRGQGLSHHRSSRERGASRTQ